jgi:hypothetical protein
VAIDEIIRDISDNVYAITIILGGVAWIAKYAINKNNQMVKYELEKLKNEYSDENKATCKHFTDRCDAIEKNVDRHEHWFERFFSRFMKGFQDIRYRDSVFNNDDENGSTF